jgi:hypothetical protein
MFVNIDLLKLNNINDAAALLMSDNFITNSLTISGQLTKLNTLLDITPDAPDLLSFPVDVWRNYSLNQIINNLTSTNNSTLNDLVVANCGGTKILKKSYLPPPNSINNYVLIWEDFTTTEPTNGMDVAAFSGTTSASFVNPTDFQPFGVKEFRLRNSTNNRVSYLTSTSSFRVDAFSQFCMKFSIDTKSIFSSGGLVIQAGFFNSTTGAPGEAIMWRWAGTSSTKWHLVARTSSTETILNSTKNIFADQYVSLELYGTPNRIEGYINGEYCGSIITNIPTSQTMGFGVQLRQNASSTIQICRYDYALFIGRLKASR